MWSLVLVRARPQEVEMQDEKKKREKKKDMKRRDISNPFLKEQLAVRSFTVKALLTAKDPLTTQPSLANHTAQRTALVWRALVTEEHGRRLDSPLGRIIKDTDISIEADDQVTLLRLQTDLGSGISAAETDDVLQGVLCVFIFGGGGQALAAAEVCPEDRQAQADGGDATPG